MSAPVSITAVVLVAPGAIVRRISPATPFDVFWLESDFNLNGGAGNTDVAVYLNEVARAAYDGRPL